MENAQTAHAVLGPWDGIDETGNGGKTKVVDGLNVQFRDGLVCRRPGRSVLFEDASNRRFAGLHEYVGVDGTRQIVGYIDGRGYVRLNFQTWTLDDLTGTDIPEATLEGRFTTAANIDSVLVVTDPSGELVYFDGTSMFRLEANPGIDSGVNLESYLATPPSASVLAVWRDRLVAAGDPGAPRLIALSENRWNVANIPADAAVGGANVWPSRTNFDLATEEGDIVSSVAVIYDRLAVIGRSGVAMVDEDSVAPYARIVARQHGCVAPRSVVNIGDRLLYLGEGAVYSFDGTSARVISMPLSRTLKEVVDWSQIGSAIAVNLRHAREYRVWVPIRGYAGNRLCLIYNYERDSWTKWSGWYTFDPSYFQNLTGVDVTAAISSIDASGRERLITGTSDGFVILEDSGDNDPDLDFQAFFALAPINRGAEVETFTDWRVDCLHDGCIVAGLGVIDGRSIEREIMRVYNQDLVPTTVGDIPYVLARAVVKDEPSFYLPPTYPFAFSGARMDELHLGLRQRTRKLQPVILMPGSGVPPETGVGVNDATPGGIRQIEIGIRSRSGRR